MNLWKKFFKSKPRLDAQDAAKLDAYLAQFKNPAYLERLAREPSEKLENLRDDLRAGRFPCLGPEAQAVFEKTIKRHKKFEEVTEALSPIGGISLIALPFSLALYSSGAVALVVPLVSLGILVGFFIAYTKKDPALLTKGDEALAALAPVIEKRKTLEERLETLTCEMRLLHAPDIVEASVKAFRRDNHMDPAPQLESGIKGYLPAPKTPLQ